MYPTNPFRHSETPNGSLFAKPGEESRNATARVAFDVAEQAFKEKKEKELQERRQQVIDWALEAGKDEAWVDETFVITADEIRCEGNLDLHKAPITKLIDALTHVGGNLDIYNTKITALPDKLTIAGSLYISNESSDAPDSFKACCHAAKDAGRIGNIVYA